MAYAMLDGPLGLEGFHVWTPANDPSLAITMNDLTPGATVHYIRFKRMPGFRALPEADDNRQPRTARVGENVMPSMVRGKTFTVEGLIQAASMAELRQMEWAMSAALGERDLEGTWSTLPHSAYGSQAAYWQAAMRVMQYEPDEEFTIAPDAALGPYQLHFLLGMRMSDPRWTWSAAPAAATGGGSATAVNLGNAPAEPIITVSGAGTNVSIGNDQLNKGLRFEGMSGGGSLVVNFAARTATLAGVDAAPYLDSYDSTWWDRGVPGLRPGSNDITQTGGSGLSVAWRHTAW